MNNNYIIYFLFNTSHNKTYIGITNNQTKRIRQHNGEISGGAKYTTANKSTGEWQYYGWIKSINGVLEKNRSLSIEKKIKIRSRQCIGNSFEKRILAIDSLLEENIDLEFINNVFL
jgi:predicted GIY-YIG superfamily endonuclease